MISKARLSCAGNILVAVNHRAPTVIQNPNYHRHRRHRRGLSPSAYSRASLISRHIPNAEATAEITTTSVDNVDLVQGNRAGMVFSRPDTAWDGNSGQLKGMKDKANIRSLMALYSNCVHIVAIDDSGINSVADLKSKRVSTGAPGSKVEVKLVNQAEELYPLA